MSESNNRLNLIAGKKYHIVLKTEISGRPWHLIGKFLSERDHLLEFWDTKEQEAFLVAFYAIEYIYPYLEKDKERGEPHD